MALAGYHFKFLAIDAGVQERISDGGVLKNFAMYYAMENNTLKFLPPGLLSYRTPLPFVFVGDDAFQLTKFFMKPYGPKNIADDQSMFNYRLSHHVNEEQRKIYLALG